jgi:hypothetical protein
LKSGKYYNLIERLNKKLDKRKRKVRNKIKKVKNYLNNTIIKENRYTESRKIIE